MNLQAGRIFLVVSIFSQLACGVPSWGSGSMAPSKTLYFSTSAPSIDEVGRSIREFSRANGLKLDESIKDWPDMGRSYVFYLNSKDLQIHGGNSIVGYAIDPNGYGGPPPPKFDTRSYYVYVYRKNPSLPDKEVSIITERFQRSMSNVEGLTFHTSPKLLQLPPK